ncbi:hypothetical protein AYO40_03235 [Planctomycetaceae bacterium SCGC AG-212-D15]|nr:hypothetical protein AYO40_03235 [Planctomycetaceae bacterium SCGC AG-212-D15]
MTKLRLNSIVLPPALALLYVVLVPGAAAAQRLLQRFLPQPISPQQSSPQPSSWVGQRVMQMRAGLQSGHTESDKFVRDADLTDFVYKVLNEQDGWFYVNHRGIEGWVPGNEVIPLDQAVSHFSERIRLNSNDAFAFAARGRAWREDGELERALKDLNEAIRLEPKNARWYGNRGLVYDELDEPDRALDDYDDAIRLDAKEPQHLIGRGRVYKGNREYDKAIADYTAALRLDPKSTDAYFNRANAYKAKRDYDEAVRDYTEAIRLDAEAPDAYFNRANARKAKREFAEAVRDLKAVIRLDPDDADAHGSLAWLLACCADERVRDGKKAVEHATKACELTSWAASYFLATLGVAYAEAGDFTQAVRWQEKALESPRYERDEGEDARDRIKRFKNGQPYREK